MTTIDKLANELFPCPSNCPSKQMTAKYMRENFKQAVNLIVDEIRRVNGVHRVTPNFGEVRSNILTDELIDSARLKPTFYNTPNPTIPPPIKHLITHTNDASREK